MIIIPEYRIVVGGEPELNLFKEKALPDVVVNVADYPDICFGSFNMKPNFYYWYPINEVSKWGYTPFFWSKRILDFHTERRESIFVHCSAGAHRSPMMVFAWLMGRHYTDSQLNDFMGSNEYFKAYHMDVEEGRIPDDLMKLYSIMDGDLRASLLECLMHMGKKYER